MESTVTLLKANVSIDSILETKMRYLGETLAVLYFLSEPDSFFHSMDFGKIFKTL